MRKWIALLRGVLGLGLVLGSMGQVAGQQCPYVPRTPGTADPQCPIKLVQIQGRVPGGNGRLLTQVWVGADAVTGDGTSQGRFSLAFSDSGANGFPRHPNATPTQTLLWPMVGINYTGTSPTQSSATPYGWPVCMGNCSGNGDGNSKGAEQVQQDGWLFIPDSIHCLPLSFSRATEKAAALYLSDDGTLAGMKRVLECLRPGTGSLTVDWTVPGNLPRDSSGFRYTRIRLYHHDARDTADTELKWNIGNGFETIPAAFFQSVSQPQSEAAPASGTQGYNGAFAYLDSVGNLFRRLDSHQLGVRILLDPRYKEDTVAVMENVHPDNRCFSTSCTIPTVVRVTRSKPNAEGKVFQKLWRTNSAFVSGTPGQQDYMEAFSISSLGPYEHLNSVNGTSPKADLFGALISNNLNGSFQATQDAWLAVPPRIKCLRVRLGASGRQQSTAIWLGASFRGMREVASEVNGELVGGTYVLPDNLPSAGKGWRWVRARVYVHQDSGAPYDSRVQWDLGQGLEYIESSYMVACKSARDNIPPGSLLTRLSSREYGLMLADSTVWVPNGTGPLTIPIRVRDSLNRILEIVRLVSCTGALPPTGSGPDCAAAFSGDPCNRQPIAVDDTFDVVQGVDTILSPLLNDSDDDPRDIPILKIVRLFGTATGSLGIVPGDSTKLQYINDGNNGFTDDFHYVIRDDGIINQYDTASIHIIISKDYDSDRVPDRVDLDDDNDGIPDSVEDSTARNPVDMDGNGDMHGDTDRDGGPDFHDLDSDNDGVPDIQEYGWNPSSASTGHAPVGGSGRLLYDALGGPNGWDDYAEYTLKRIYNSDGDSVPDFQDLDSDNDGIYDIVERGLQSFADSSGVFFTLSDLDSNSWDDRSQSVDTMDGDGDGVLERLDLDSDNDGIPNIVEAWQSDDNHDGRLDAFLDTLDGADDARMHNGRYDQDHDGIPNHLDLDADNDGLSDLLEDNRQDTSQTDTGRYAVPFLDSIPDGWLDTLIGAGRYNTDKDSVPNFLDLDSDNDGLYDRDEETARFRGDTGMVTGGTLAAGWDTDERILVERDSDGDGRADRQDLDSDNDGIPDVVEAGGDDGAILDGMLDSIADADSNGTDDRKMRATAAMSDQDTIPDHLDLDADNDGRVDYHEAGGEQAHGVYMAFVDVDDLDGWSNEEPLSPEKDSDKDSVPDRRDLDSDNDGIYDLHESAPMLLSDSLDRQPRDGRIDSLILHNDSSWYPYLTTFPFMDTDDDGVHDPVDLDSDNDGLADLFEDSLGYKDNAPGRIPASVTVDSRGVASRWMRIHRLDWDKDSIPDFRDLDSDNDGIADVVESGYEGSGLYGTVDPPFNADGWIDGSVEEGGNKDGDSLFNHRDHDSDNDGIPDVIEGDGVHLRRLGMIVEGFQDTDSTDGWDDAHYGTKPLNSGDDDQPDFLDRDSDEDSISDFLESRPDALGADKDGNGEIDVLRLNAYGWDSVHGTIDPMNTDLTDLPDYRDRDSDNDSVSDAYEYQFVRDGHSCGHPSVLPIWRDSVLCKVIFYQGFSPNGDRLNDEFVVPGIGYRRNNVFTVFNRWGDVVYKSSPWNGTWDFVGNRGLFANEKPVPDGIYYFTLEFGKNAQHGYFYVRDSKGEDP